MFVHLLGNYMVVCSNFGMNERDQKTLVVLRSRWKG